MRLAITALAAVLLVAGDSPSRAQDTAGAANSPNGTTAAPKPATGSAGISISPKTRKKLLRDLVNAIIPPRPAAPSAAPAEPGTAQPAATPASIPDAGTVTPIPTPPHPVIVAPTPAATPPVPRPAATIIPRPRPAVAPSPSNPAPRPGPQKAPPAPIEQTASPIPPPIISPPIGSAPQAIAPVSPQPPPPIAEPARLGFATNPILLGLLAALAGIAAATALRVQRIRRIERTRAALKLTPRIDLAAGAGAIHGLAT